MPYCPVCKHQFDEPATECPNDRVPLVGELPFQTVDGQNMTWVEIASFGSEEEGRLLQGFLETEGIAAQVESVKFTMEPVTIGQMAEIRVYVPSESESRALELLTDREEQFAGAADDDVLTEDGPADIDENAEPTREGEEP